MTCRETVDFLMDYIDGQLPEETKQSFERHLSICPACLAFVASYRKAVELGRSAMLDPAAAGPPIPDDVVRAILASRAGTDR